MAGYYRPSTIEDAASILQRESGHVLPLAGGTDLVPRWAAGATSRPAGILDVKHVHGLTGISRRNGEVCIGACTCMSDIERDPIVRATAPVLSEAAGRVACPQIRNRATIGGNLCNASPAADTAGPLILLDAVVDLMRLERGGPVVRSVPVAEFFSGPGATVRAPDELLTQIRFAAPEASIFFAWDKFGTRPAMEIAVASVGVALGLTSGRVSFSRVAYGSVAPVPLRGRAAEAALLDHPPSPDATAGCVAAAREEVSPINDVRAGERYRRDVLSAMLQRMLERAAGS